MRRGSEKSWSRLDNAAKIFPSNSSKDDTKVFRFTCELYEQVEPSALQQAVEKTLAAFPIYKSILRRGLFWYYLESSDLKPVVRLEDSPPCSPIYDRNTKNLLFEVTYFQNRINLEVFHALSDGTGALQFLKSLVFRYLVLAHPDLSTQPPDLDYDASVAEKMDDSFRRYYSKGGRQSRKARMKPEDACHIKGQRLAEHRIGVIEGVLSSQAVAAKAKEYGATVTVFLTAVFMCAINQEIPLTEKKKPVVVTIPVNLRRFFPSESARNFFSVINVGYDFSKSDNSLEAVIASVKQSFDIELTPEKVKEKMNGYSAIERNVFARATPLIVKDVALHVAHSLSSAEVTASLSNIGRIFMPKELVPYIRLFDVFVSTNKVQICMCSFQDNMVVSFTSAFTSTNIQKHFFRTLAQMGIPAEIATNEMEE